ncbi:FYVE and coiled-coil domain-containing protein 1-like [Acipenser ruthenus]|uniref:FYVE and coiled-coil domain-containing protein 1-like n=1 Tax=Acipenser ruthenus TaxID=7906 RepID=UPI0027405DD9|nr:FYVE and coiled-coil domain-containing protein 1-like [Acipenser ruthenus]XP_058870556.1 FYVE and coiled-coil domain-containing protein 1-like [Acipenser ruthenus]XP_058870563.1 FYVE and coiled-coil domain-containing protein 1-like [Acipenser ruthenus]
MAVSVGENQLQRIIRDLHDAVSELSKEYTENGEPITDDSTSLQKFSYKLEYLLQFDQKEKTTFLGTRKDYWDYFSDCLAKIKGANDGIRFVKSIPELKTSLGKGRAFIRYSLVHQRLADTLQQCLINVKVTGDWYYSRSPLLKPHLNADIINHLYELNEVQFDIASRGHDLDAAWPTFARRTLGLVNSPAHFWKPPSRSSSINSLVSSYSQAHDFPSSPDFNHSLMSEPVSIVDELRIELDQSEIKRLKLQEQVNQLEQEKQELLKISSQPEGQLEVSLSTKSTAHDLQQCLKTLNSSEKLKDSQETVVWLEKTTGDCASHFQSLTEELEAIEASEQIKDSNSSIQARPNVVEQKNLKFLAKLDGVLNEKGQQTASHCDTAQKIHELRDNFSVTEEEKIEMQKNRSEQDSPIEKLTDELMLREDAAGEIESKFNSLTIISAEENCKINKQVGDLKNTKDTFEEAPTVKEREASNLKMQLQDMQRHTELLEKQYEEKEKGIWKEMQQKYDTLKESLEEQIHSLTEQLKAKEKDLSNSNINVQKLDEHRIKIINEKEGLINTIAELEENMKRQSDKLEQSKIECSNWKSLHEKLQQTIKRTEDTNKELMENRTVQEDELASLRASEKHLQSQIDDTMVTVDEKEKKLREENRHLDESYQKALMQNAVFEEAIKKFEDENKDLKQDEANLKEEISSLKIDMKRHVTELEKNIAALKKREKSLEEQLQEKHRLLEEKEKFIDGLLDKSVTFEKQVRELQREKLNLENAILQQTKSMESLTTEKASVEKAINSQMYAAERQLELNMKEVGRLQAKVIDLRGKLQSASEERMKTQAKLNVTEASLEELRTFTEQLKGQIESLNRNHVQELVQFREKEDCLRKDKESEAKAWAEHETMTSSLKDQMSVLKQYLEKLELENTETKELLQRANVEMAELGIQICTLTSEKEDAKEKWTRVSLQLQEQCEEAGKEINKLNASMAALRQENESLQEELKQSENLADAILDLQAKLEKTEKQAKSLQETSKEEVFAVKFQMSSEVLNYQNKVKSVTEELENIKGQLKEHEEKMSDLEATASQLKVVNSDYSKQLDEKAEQVKNSEALIQQNAEELQSLKDNLARIQEELSASQKQSKEYRDELDKTVAEKQKKQLELLAELDDLTQTKQNLEERLIELIKDKDALWQKSDALEFEQKVRAEERWLVDRETNHCLDCKSQFTWWLRRHHCRLCGRIFCYYCSNNFVMTKHSGKKERCCRECYMQHSAVIKRFSQADACSAPETPEGSPSLSAQPPPRPSPSVTVTDGVSKQDDVTFDIITDEELNVIDDSDSLLPTDAEAPGSLKESFEQGTAEQNASSEVITPDELEPTVQDAEIYLLKSGELTLRVPLNIEEIIQFGDDSRELFIKSSCYSVIPIAVEEAGPTISWVFSSEPKSISFSVVYQESAESPLEQSKVLIPLTRCKSHQETVQGQLKVRNPGSYMLIFDNSFSRFISKKVFYNLTIEKPIIYDGSDFP